MNLEQNIWRRKTKIRIASLIKIPKTILDESTSALDIETEQEIINDIHEIMKNKTIIIISHRKST